MYLVNEWNWSVSNGVSPIQFRGLSNMNCGGSNVYHYKCYKSSVIYCK